MISSEIMQIINKWPFIYFSSHLKTDPNPNPKHSCKKREKQLRNITMSMLR